MPMTLRLSPEGEERLEQLAKTTHLSKTSVVELALANLAEQTSHRSRVDAAFELVRARDAKLLELLAE